MSFIICFIKYGTIITNTLLHDENLNLKSSDKYVEKKKRYDPDDANFGWNKRTVEVINK